MVLQEVLSVRFVGTIRQMVLPVVFNRQAFGNYETFNRH